MITSELSSPFKGMSLPVRPLPLRIRPVIDETVDSYFKRLASANGYFFSVLRDHITGTLKVRAVPPQAVLGLSGRPERKMRYAMLEFNSPQELANMSIVGRPRPGIVGGTKCRSCTRAMGIEPPVVVWRRTEDVLCHRHRRWPGTEHDIDLTDYPEVIQANKLHRRLIRKLGRKEVLPAFRSAKAIVDEWADRPSYRTEYDRRMRRFHGPKWKVSWRDPTVLASKYPQTVGLTRLLAVPYWKALALADPDGSPAFVEELRRTVEPQYDWYRYSHYRYYEPVVRWFQDEREYRRDPRWRMPVELDVFDTANDD